MIEIDLRNDGHFRNDHIRRIEPPAQSDLNHGEIHPPACKSVERHGRDTLEVSGMRGKRSRSQQFLDNRQNSRK